MSDYKHAYMSPTNIHNLELRIFRICPFLDFHICGQMEIIEIEKYGNSINQKVCKY